MFGCFGMCYCKDFMHYMCVLSVVKCYEYFVQGSLCLGREKPDRYGEVRWKSNKETPQK